MTLHQRLRAEAVASPPLALLAEAATVEDVDVSRRTITGLVVPYGVGGRTNLGHGLAVRAGAVRFREPHRRVIGLYGHERNAPVARMTAHEDRPTGLAMRFRVAATPLGDQLLAEAADGVRSSLSIELDDVAVDGLRAEITSGLCEFVAFVPLGAYDDAQVTTVTASAHNTGGDDVRRRFISSRQREFIQVGGGGQPGQPVPVAQAPAAPAPAAPAPAPAVVPQQQLQQPQQLQAQQAPAAQPQGQVDFAALAAFVQASGLLQQQPQGSPAPLQQQQPQQLQAQQYFIPAQQQQLPQGTPYTHGGTPAFLPGGLQAPAVPQQQQQGGTNAIRNMARLQAALCRGEDTTQLRAALADITNTGLDIFQRPAGALGEQLWTGGTYQRRFTPLFRNKELTSWKFGGWRWVTKPVLEHYAGDKALINGNPVEVEYVEEEASRVAGGWDIDRKYRDFGDEAFWTGFYEAQVESYREITDDDAATALIGFAKDISVDANVPAEYAGSNDPVPVGPTQVLKAAALGTAILEDTPNVRTSPNYVVLNTADWLALMDLSNLDLPAFLAMLGVSPSGFLRSGKVAKGDVLMGVTQAATFRELGGGAPIRVEALDVARAGVDSAVYGYTGFHLDRPGGIITVPLAQPA